MARHLTGFTAVLALVLCLGPFARPSLGEGGAQRVTLDDLLGAYLGGDFGVVERTFVRSVDLQRRLRLDRPRELEGWLGSWDRAKALLLLELARTSATVAPQYVFVIVGTGRRYLAANPDSRKAAADHTTDFVRVWHRAAAGLLQGASDPEKVEEHVTDPGPANGGPNVPMDGRFLLARAIAQERRCWAGRPSLDQPAIRIEGLLAIAGAGVPEDSVGPSKSGREAIVTRHRVCLREALSRFEAAAGVEDSAAEARVRGGWTLFQDGYYAEAIEWLDAAKPRDDRDLEYWHGLFRGRVLEALGRFQDAAHAYQAALALYPRAQSAGLGLSIVLMRLDRTKEADEIARSVRQGGATTPDPWVYYHQGDKRFAERWIDSLRTSVR